MKRVVFVIVFLLCFSKIVLASDDFQYWPQLELKMIDTKRIDWFIFSEGHLTNDAKDVDFYFISQKVKYDFLKNLSFGTNYTYAQYKKATPSAGRALLNLQHRLELEVNPYWNVGDWLKISNRNRVEFRWIEDAGSSNTRLRHQWTFSHSIKNVERIKEVYMSSEFFYNQAGHSYDENRTVPFGVGLKITDKSSLKLFYLVQSKKSREWTTNHALGSLFSVSF